MIRIGIDPTIFQIGVFAISWHGLFTFIAVVLAVLLVARWAGRERLDTDVVFSIAIWAIISGIIGAKLVHVIDRWDVYSHNLGQIFSNAGIALYGAIIFGFLGGFGFVKLRQLLGRIYAGETMGWFKRLVGDRIAEGYLKGEVYAKFKSFSAGRLADITAPAMLIAQTVGRIGDIINGEHVAQRTDLPWGFIYTHPDSLSYQQWGLNASHPAVLYEMIWNMAALGIIWMLRKRLSPPGTLFAVYMMLYAMGRFFIQFLRMDKVWFAGLQEAHVISLLVLAVTVPLLAYKARWVSPGSEARERQRQRR